MFEDQKKKEESKYDWTSLGKTWGITFNDKSKGMYEYYKEKYTDDKEFNKQFKNYVSKIKKDMKDSKESKSVSKPKEKKDEGKVVSENVSNFAKNLLSKLEAQLATATTSEEKAAINKKIADLKAKYKL